MLVNAKGQWSAKSGPQREPSAVLLYHKSMTQGPLEAQAYNLFSAM